MFADPRVQLFIRSEEPGDAAPTVERRYLPREFADEPPTDRERNAVKAAPQGGPLRSAQELARAEADLRRALAQDPERVEARIRLAHVVGERGHPDEAIALVQEALRARLPRFFEIYATLILGRSQARTGRFAEALASFDRAAALSPAAQAPRVGRSQAVLAAGRPADALAALTHALGPERVVEAGDEEWAVHFRVHDPPALAQLAALRAEVK
jgi:tetratricopeptide (TPR) repeat protein